MNYRFSFPGYDNKNIESANYIAANVNDASSYRSNVRFDPDNLATGWSTNFS